VIDLLLCRHGEASFDAPSDRQRPLTAQGIAQTTGNINSNADLLASVTELWCSDLLRAQQTAQLFTDHSGLNAKQQSFLRPDSLPERLIRKFEPIADGQCLLVVAHMPLLGDIVSLLTEGHPYSAHPFQTSEIVHLRGELLASGLCEIIPLSS